MHSTRSRGRTGTILLSLVFETNASTDSAIRARPFFRERIGCANVGIYSQFANSEPIKMAVAVFPQSLRPHRRDTEVLYCVGKGRSAVLSAYRLRVAEMSCGLGGLPADGQEDAKCLRRRCVLAAPISSMSSSSEALRMRATVRKCPSSVSTVRGPIPAMPLSSLLRKSLLRFWRWKVMPKRCASSRIWHTTLSGSPVRLR